MPSLHRFRLALILMLLLPGAAAAGVWEPAGPEGGHIPSIALDLSTPQTLYAAADFGGVFKSLDSGADWSRAGEGLQGADVAALAPDPGHPGTIYAGTSQGVFRSDDGGASWPVQGTGLHPGTVNVLLVTPDAVYADIVFESSGPIAPRALYKSTDRGESWSPLSLSTVAALALDPADPHLLYAGTRGTGVLHSTNGGASWTGAARGLPAQAFVNALATFPGVGKTVYAAIEGHGVFLSTDGGNRWRSMSRGLGGLDVVALAAGPAPSTLYAVAKMGFSNPILFRTTDGGAHWVQAGPGLPSDFLTLAADPRGGTVYVGTESGVLRSLDSGATWSAADHGLRAVPALSVLADPQRPGIAYVTSLSAATPADPGSGLQKTVNGGAGWNRISVIDGLPFLFAIDPQRPATLYLSNGALRRSRNGGRTWASLGPDVELLAIDPGQPSVLYRTQSGRIDRSTDGGATWKTDFTLPCSEPISLTVSPSSEVFVGMVACNSSEASSPVYRRAADGSWAPAAIGLPAALVLQAFVAADPRRPSTVYASVFLTSPDPAVNSSFGETFRSTDGGVSWKLVADPQDGLGTVFAFPPGEPEAVYAFYISPVGTDVYRSDDGGQSWAPAGGGITGNLVFSLSAGMGTPAPVYAATQGGLYKLVSDPP